MRTSTTDANGLLPMSYFFDSLDLERKAAYYFAKKTKDSCDVTGVMHMQTVISGLEQ